MTFLSLRLNRRRQGIVLGVGALLLAVAGVWVLTLLPIADPLPPSLQSWRTVGSYFDNPPAWPGKPWTTKDGFGVDRQVLEAAAGPSHCGLDSLTFLNIGWPLGTSSTTADQNRLYIRDPNGKVSIPGLIGTWARNPSLPADARDTGYRYGALKLYLSPSDEDTYAYLIAPADSERCPRASLSWGAPEDVRSSCTRPKRHSYRVVTFRSAPGRILS